MSLFYKKIFPLFLCAAALCALAKPAAAADTPRALVYTALGDSISTGYRLSDHADAYVSLFGVYLDADTDDLGQNGLDSAGLLKKLQSDQNVIARVKKSDIITVSMGGNDLLSTFSDLNPTSLTSLVKAIGQITGSAKQKEFNTAVATFGKQWEKITARLKELAPNATIIVTTLVNPYEGIIVPLINFNFGNYSDGYVKKLNTVIKKDADSGGYVVADSYALFKKHTSEQLTNANLPKLDFDPHPNVAGHKLIAAAHEALKLTFAQNAVDIAGAKKITIPYANSTASAAYTATPLLTVFTNDTATQTSFTVEDAGGTGAEMTDGKLTVSHAGTLTLRATLTASDKPLTATAELRVRVGKALPPQLEKQLPKLYIAAGTVCVLLAALLLTFILKRRKRRRTAGRKR